MKIFVVENICSSCHQIQFKLKASRAEALTSSW